MADIWDNPNYQWLQQLGAGANIANTGWQTALGLMLGTGLGSWLGHQFWNWQQARDEKMQINPDTTKALANQAAQNLLGNNFNGNDFNLGWRPPQDYRWPTAQEALWNGVGYPNRRQAAIDSLTQSTKDYIQKNFPPPYTFNAPQTAAEIFGTSPYNPRQAAIDSLIPEDYIQTKFPPPKPNQYQFNKPTANSILDSTRRYTPPPSPLTVKTDWLAQQQPYNFNNWNGRW